MTPVIERPLWFVRFVAQLKRGEPPQVVRVEVPDVASEAAAIRAALVKHFGGVNRSLQTLEMLEVRQLR